MTNLRFLGRLFLKNVFSLSDPIESLKFGALISPTDPVAILSVLGSLGGVPKIMNFAFKIMNFLLKIMRPLMFC